jgi:hypothetical protein
MPMDVFRPVQIVTVVDTLPIVTTAEANQTPSMQR